MSVVKESSAWAEDYPRRKLDFEWSLKPMTTLMRCIGIPLDFRSYQQFDGGGYSWFVSGFGILLFFMDGLCQFNLTATTIYQATELQSSKNSSHSAALKWNVCINSMNYVILILGSHILLFAVSLVNWPKFLRVLRCIEERSFFKEQDFRKFRFPCFVLLALSVTELIICILDVYYTWTDNPLTYQLTVIGILLFLVLVSISFYYLCALCWIAYLMLNALSEEIKTSDKEKQSSSQLKLWKAKYFMTEEFVHHTNCCFGPFLLLLTTSYFVKMTNNSFFLFSNLTKSNDDERKAHFYMLLIFLIKDWICFVALTYIPSLARQEAIKITKRLKNLHCKDSNLNNQMEFLRMEISLSLPQITAAGFFDIDCKLIPTMVGTTLTYLIILYQFDSIEKENLDSTT